MLVSIIAALDRRGLIGDGSGMPWHLPNDLRRFRQLTMGKPIIMGRTTHESIGKPLPGRLNIVLSHNTSYTAPDCRVAQTLPTAFSIAEEYLALTGGEETMIIGGGKVYAEAIHLCDRLYLTIVDGEFKGNTYFPIKELLQQNWHLACEPEKQVPDEKNRYPHTFCIVERGSETTPQVSGDQSDRITDVDLAALLRLSVMP